MMGLCLAAAAAAAVAALILCLESAGLVFAVLERAPQALLVLHVALGKG